MTLLRHLIWWDRLDRAFDRAMAKSLSILKERRSKKPAGKADVRVRAIPALLQRLRRYERAGLPADDPRVLATLRHIHEIRVAYIKGALAYLNRRQRARASARNQVAPAARRRGPSEFDKLSVIHKAGMRDPNLVPALREMYYQGHLNAAYRKAQEVLRGYEDIEV